MRHPQKLVLTTTSLHNVVISNASDVIYYEVITPKWERNLTRISRLDPNTQQFDLIGELKNEDDRPVEMRMYGGAFRSTGEFLKKEPNGEVVGRETDGVRETESDGGLPFERREAKEKTLRRDEEQILQGRSTGYGDAIGQPSTSAGPGSAKQVEGSRGSNLPDLLPRTPQSREGHDAQETSKRPPDNAHKAKARKEKWCE